MKISIRYFFIMLLIFIGSIFTVNGQGYISMVKEGNKVVLKFPMGWGQYGYETQIIRCDTLIGGKIYKKVYLDRNCGYAGALREDTINQKIFSVKANSNQEILFIDFSVNVGDTVAWGPWGPTFSNIVGSISYKFLFGRIRKEIKFSQGGGDWVEGIGSSITGFSQHPCISNMHWINSSGTTGAGCLLMPVGYKENQETRLNIYPNPAKDYLIVETGDKEAVHSGVYSVYNMLGQEVKSGILNQNSSRIELRNLKPGIYLIKMNLKGREKVMKFQVQE